MTLPLIPWQAKGVAICAAAAAIFATGWKVEGWRDAGTLGAEQLAHQHDVAKLQSDWAANITAETKRADQAEAARAADMMADEAKRQAAEDAYEKSIRKHQTDAAVAVASAQQLRDQLAAAIAAGRVAGRSGAVQPAGPGASCGGTGGAAACELLSRALDLARRCADVAGQQHAALVEALAAWPKGATATPSASR
jgi:hypothetical protein